MKHFLLDVENSFDIFLAIFVDCIIQLCHVIVNALKELGLNLLKLLLNFIDILIVLELQLKPDILQIIIFIEKSLKYIFIMTFDFFLKFINLILHINNDLIFFDNFVVVSCFWFL